jgi:hypothetical protein
MSSPGIARSRNQEMRRVRAEGIRGGRHRALPALREESERLLSELEGDILPVIHGDPGARLGQKSLALFSPNYS